MKFLAEGLRLPKELDLHRTPRAKSVAMLTTMSFSHPCFRLSSGVVLAIQSNLVNTTLVYTTPSM